MRYISSSCIISFYSFSSVESSVTSVTEKLRETDSVSETKRASERICVDTSSAKSRRLARREPLDADARDRFTPSPFALVRVGFRAVAVAGRFAVLADTVQLLESSFFCGKKQHFCPANAFTRR